MEIRMLREEELLDALHLTWEVFAETIAPVYSKEGVEEFQKFIRFDNIRGMFARREIYFWGCFDNGALAGCIAASQTGHINLLFVKKEYQHRGIATQLTGCVKLYAAQVLKTPILTVNAVPSAVEFYQKAGFYVTGAAKTVNGIIFVPMECTGAAPVMTAAPEEVRRKRNRNIIIGVAIGAGVLVLLVLLLCASLLFGVKREMKSFDYYNEYDGDYGNDHSYGYEGIYPEEDYDGEEPSGIENIDDYKADDISYTLSDGSYREQSGHGTNYIEFNVSYPVISGLDSSKEDEVNKIIQDCAMKTVDEIYTNPSQDMKERMIGSPNTALVSIVEYKVCYQSNDFLSIVFNDQCYKGTEYGGIELRAVNINLKTGEVYDVKDVVNLKGSFMNAWLESMKGEAPNADFLSEVSLEDFKKVLEGDTLDGQYSNVFFVDEDGIEIGLSVFHHQEEIGEDANAFYGWITGPFTYQEINRFKTDSSFWNLVNH